MGRREEGRGGRKGRKEGEEGRGGKKGRKEGKRGEGKERVSGLMDTLCTVPRGRGGPGSAPGGRWHL